MQDSKWDREPSPNPKSRKNLTTDRIRWNLSKRARTRDQRVGSLFRTETSASVTKSLSEKDSRPFPSSELKRGQEPIVRSTLWAIWLLVTDPFLMPGLNASTGSMGV